MERSVETLALLVSFDAKAGHEPDDHQQYERGDGAVSGGDENADGLDRDLESVAFDGARNAADRLRGEHAGERRSGDTAEAGDGVGRRPADVVLRAGLRLGFVDNGVGAG